MESGTAVIHKNILYNILYVFWNYIRQGAGYIFENYTYNLTEWKTLQCYYRVSHLFSLQSI